MVRFRILRVLLVIFGALGVVVIAKSLLVLYALAQGAKAIPEARAIILMSTVVLLVCFGLSAFLIFRLISGRVYRLLTAMEQVRQGEYPLLVVSGKDEIADVTRGFNRMVEEIRTRDSKLKNWSGQRENEMAKLSHNLEVERGKLEVVLQSIGEGIVVLDNENRVLMANRRVADIFGIPLEALSGADLGTLIATVHERLVNPEVVDQQFQELQRNTGSVDEIALRLDGP